MPTSQSESVPQKFSTAANYREPPSHRCARLVPLVFEVLFPLIGCLVIAYGTLTAIFNEWSSRMQKK